jgi:DNA polymerase-3 subunit epsilon
MIIDNEKDFIEIKNISKIPTLKMSKLCDDDLKVIFCSIATTSLNSSNGDLLRVNLKLCYINKSGDFSKSRKTVSFFQDPCRKLSEDEQRFLDFSLVEKSGSKIDWDLISRLFEGADLVVSHNSSFVKPWIEKHIGTTSTLWGCSMEHIDWNTTGFPSRSLSVLSVFTGFFYDFKDSAAALEALTHVLDINRKTSSMITRAHTPDLQIFAANSPRGSNNLLKERRYRWNPDIGSWWLSIENREQGQVEEAWLLENLQGVEPQIFEIDPKYRFSK